MSEVPKTVWVTKWALFAGLKEYVHLRGWGKSGVVVRLLDGGPELHLTAGDCHPTYEAALARANEMKAAKIASLKRQIERLESLEF